MDMSFEFNPVRDKVKVGICNRLEGISRLE